MRIGGRLVFDIGAHTGEDTDFYLGKGFRVVAVEANPNLAAHLTQRFAAAIADGQLTVLQMAVLRRAEGSTVLYVNEEHDDWTSTHRDVASKGGMSVTEVRVPSTDLVELCTRFGVPYYLKVDIEMGDAAVAESLADLPLIPDYCSFEFHDDEMLDLLCAAGYSEFQIVNQWLNGLIEPVSPPREGLDYRPPRFTGFHSGLFGRELPEGDWVDESGARLWRSCNNVIQQYGLMRNSWFDLHARSLAGRSPIFEPP